MNAISNPICSKNDLKTPKTLSEDETCLFFQVPSRQFVLKQHTRESLKKKIGTIEHLSSPLLKRIDAGESIYIAMEFADPPRKHAYIPSLASMRSIAQHYKKKYRIEIDFVPEKNAVSKILDLTKSGNATLRGMIIFQEDTYHITPVLLYRQTLESNWQVLIMNCNGPKVELAAEILKGNPKNELLISHGNRVADGHSCRVEGISLLKFALIWFQKKSPASLSKLISTKDALVANIPVKIFVVPKQWAVGCHIKTGIQGAVSLSKDPINHKNETYDQWQRRQPKITQIKISIMDQDKTEVCAITVKKEISLYTLRKTDKLLRMFISKE